MHSCGSNGDAKRILVADTSSLINLNGTHRATEILEAIPNSILVPDIVYGELIRGASKGHQDLEAVRLWEERGLVKSVSLGVHGLNLFESLVIGVVGSTLDDGEAATLALASELVAEALIDERKALRIAGELDPVVCARSTAAIILSQEVRCRLGDDGCREALESALQDARMRVPDELADEVVRLIGKERAMALRSLPIRVRR